MTLFTEVQPTPENYWRSIILFGRNVASYKFALGKSLLNLAQQGTEIVTLDQLAEPFSRSICEHLLLADKQVTSRSSRFLKTCRKFNAGETSKEQLLDATVKLGFNNVIDAFHVVHNGDIAVKFFTDDRLFERKTITGCRDALNGYQKGKCFYCFGDISVAATADDLADVDHFFPHTLKPHGIGDVIDGVWNLVLACQTCNRGAKGKFAQLPGLTFLERLHRRNNFLIESHHPLRETLILQTGADELVRRQFLQTMYHQSKELLVRNWKPEYEHEPAF
jgi:hypothetical protein